MNMRSIEFTAEEKALLAKIDFDPASEKHDAAYWRAVGEASLQLMRLLIARKGIPEIRTKYFTDPDSTSGKGAFAR